MKTTVKNLDKGTYGMTANMKKLLVDVVNMNDEKYFNVKLKVNNTSMTITPQGDNKYRVVEHTRYIHQPDLTYNVEIISK